ncbi:MAG: enoyl-CoA hydratase-related protein [Sphingomonadales bacterium]
MSEPHILFEVKESIATLTLNRPERLNAVSNQMLKEIQEAFETIEDPESGIRCLILTGAGRAFCSGADLAGGGLPSTKDKSAMKKIDLGMTLERDYNPLIERLAALRVPVVNAVNGAAAGAGCSLAIAGDIVIAAKSAYFLQAFVNIGIVPDAGSSYFLPRRIGEARAAAMMMLGEKIHADTAVDWGLVYEVVDDEALQTRALEIATKLAKGPTRALAMIRKMANQSLGNSRSEQLRLEREYQKAAGRGPEFKEGVTAFLEKRKADYTQF